jgi:hypothetical protein
MLLRLWKRHTLHEHQSWGIYTISDVVSHISVHCGCVSSNDINEQWRLIEHIFYNYIEETQLQSLYQFSDHACHPRRLPFLSSTVICFILKRLSFMVLSSSKRTNDWRVAAETGRAPHNFPPLKTRRLHCPLFLVRHNRQLNRVKELWCRRSKDAIEWNHRVAAA